MLPALSRMMGERGRVAEFLAREIWIEAGRVRLPLPSLRACAVIACVAVSVGALDRDIEVARRRRGPAPMATVLDPDGPLRFGAGPPTAGDDPAARTYRPRTDGPELVVFLSRKCGASNTAALQVGSLRTARPDVRITVVLTDSPARLDLDPARKWAAGFRVPEDALWDTSGAWGRAWLGSFPSIPYTVVLEHGLTVWGEPGASRNGSLEEPLRAWAVAQRPVKPSRSLLASHTVRLAGGRSSSTTAVASRGVWAVTYGPAANPGVRQRIGYLKRCVGPDGRPLRRLDIDDGIPNGAVRGPVERGSQAIEAVAAGPIPCEWVPYTEIWRNGEVVYAERRAHGHREVVMAAVAACIGGNAPADDRD